MVEKKPPRGFELLSMYQEEGEEEKKESELLPYFPRNITSHYCLAAGHYHTEATAKIH